MFENVWLSRSPTDDILSSRPHSGLIVKS